MDNLRLNSAIASYADSSSYEGAIMLTAEWGAGKSYYLQVELIPFLENKGIKTLVVSLHGLKNDFEISKAIYVEYLLSIDKKRIIKDNCLNNKAIKQVAAHTAFAARTIVRGIASFFNINLCCSEEELIKLYNSIDLSDTLIVFEDVERSKMPPREIMAYVNNMVEYDHNKVLLITNEKELLRLDKSDDDYIKIKEKTIGDTLRFKGDQIKAINNMISYFSQETIGHFLTKETVKNDLASEIVSEIKESVINLRSIKFGLTKFNEMMSIVNSKIDYAFEKGILISLLVFVHKYRKDNAIKWATEEDVSPELTSYKYPLYRFIYDFIVDNDLKPDALLTKQKEFTKYQKKIKAKDDLNKKLSILYSCFVQPEEDVKEVILFVRESLEDISIIPFELYFKIANYLFYIKYVIDFDEEIDSCINLMKKNLEQLPEDKLDGINYFGGIALDDTEASNAFKQFREEAMAIVKKNKMNPLSFSYQMSDLDSFCEMANNSRNTYFDDKSFASRLDIVKLIEIIKKCSALQISQMREMFLHIYAPSNIKDFFFSDKQSLEELLNGIINIKDDDYFDKIQKKQLSYFIGNLKEIIEKLERGY